MPGVMTPVRSSSTVEPMGEVARLARGGARGAEGDRPGDDRRGQEDGRDDAADDPPLEAGPRAVVGHLLDVELAVVVGLDDEHAVDVERAVDLGHEQVVVDGPSGPRVREARDDQRMVALDGDGALGQDALLVGDGGGRPRRRRRTRPQACSWSRRTCRFLPVLLVEQVPCARVIDRWNPRGSGRRSSGGGPDIVARPRPRVSLVRGDTHRLCCPMTTGDDPTIEEATDDEPTARLLRHPAARALGMARRSGRDSSSVSSSSLVVATLSFLAHRLGHGLAHAGRPRPRRCHGGHPDRPVQRAHPARRARPRGSGLARSSSGSSFSSCRSSPSSSSPTGRPGSTSTASSPRSSRRSSTRSSTRS